MPSGIYRYISTVAIKNFAPRKIAVIAVGKINAIILHTANHQIIVCQIRFNSYGIKLRGNIAVVEAFPLYAVGEGSGGIMQAAIAAGIEAVGIFVVEGEIMNIGVMIGIYIIGGGFSVALIAAYPFGMVSRSEGIGGTIYVGAA